jgi:hypothetical protein
MGNKSRQNIKVTKSSFNLAKQEAEEYFRAKQSYNDMTVKYSKNE